MTADEVANNQILRGWAAQFTRPTVAEKAAAAIAAEPWNDRYPQEKAMHDFYLREAEEYRSAHPEEDTEEFIMAELKAMEHRRLS
jgi:hypothetical protein